MDLLGYLEHSTASKEWRIHTVVKLDHMTKWIKHPSQEDRKVKKPKEMEGIWKEYKLIGGKCFDKARSWFFKKTNITGNPLVSNQRRKAEITNFSASKGDITIMHTLEDQGILWILRSILLSFK